MPPGISSSEPRTLEQLKEQYRIERELASRLRHASPRERRRLYSSLYDELFRRIPHHPMLTRKHSALERSRSVVAQMRFLQRFLSREATFLEIGPGDCALSFAVAPRVKKVYAVDVSAEITKSDAWPENFELILSDGCSLDVPPNSIQVAYSSQLVEHLHPQDAFEHLRNVYQALSPGGIYICITANRLNGPHDISGLFDEVASGFHLKEYTVTELTELFQHAGFRAVNAYVAAKGIHVKCPLFLVRWWERWIAWVPQSWRKAHANSLLFRVLLPIRVVGRKLKRGAG